MRYRAIQKHDRRFPIRLMCRALAVSAAGYYAWKDRPESRRAMHNRILLSEIRVIHRESRETYGSPSIWDALMKRGHGVGEHRIARRMRVAGTRAKTVKKWRATTDSNHPWPVARNTLNRQFQIEQPNRVWAGDMTYVWTTEGWLLSRRGARPVRAYRDRLGDGPSADRGASRAGPHPGADASEAHGGVAISLGSRQPVRGTSLPAAARRARHHQQHEPHGQRLGQCLCRKFFRDT